MKIMENRKSKSKIPRTLAISFILIFLNTVAVGFISTPEYTDTFTGITGYFVAEEDWENTKTITANSSTETVTVQIEFGKYKPADCSDGIYIEDEYSNEIDFIVISSVQKNNTCVRCEIEFDNVIYEKEPLPITTIPPEEEIPEELPPLTTLPPEKEPEPNATSQEQQELPPPITAFAAAENQITYHVYYGKIEFIEEQEVNITEEPAPELPPLKTMAGDTYYVNTTGNDSWQGNITHPWRTITYAATQADAGDTVYIKKGDYGHEHVSVDNSGNSTHPIVFEGYDSTPGDAPTNKSNMPELNGSDREGRGIQIIGKSYITFKYFYLNCYDVGFHVREDIYHNSHGFKAEGIVIDNCGRIGIYSGNGFFVSGLDDVTIDNCTLTDAGRQPVTLAHGNNITVTNVSAIGLIDPGNNTYSGYYFSMASTTNSSFINCLADNQYPTKHQGKAYTVGGGADDPAFGNRLINCTTTNTGTGFEESFILEGNGTYNNSIIDCYAGGTRNHRALTIRAGAYNNLVERFTTNHSIYSVFGMLLGGEAHGVGNGAYNNTIKNCVFSRVYHAMWWYNGSADNNVIENNIFMGEGYFPWLQEPDNRVINAYGCGGNSTNNTLKNNIFVSFGYWEKVVNIGTCPDDGGGTPIANYNNFFNNGDNFTMPNGTGNIEVNPLFVDSDNHDFHLNSTYGRWNGTAWVNDSVHSPCIDAGDPNDDYSGELSPHGGRINMGAYGNTSEASKSANESVNPFVYLISPSDSTIISDSTPTHTFYFTDQDNSTTNCTLYYNSSIKGNNASTLNNKNTNITASFTSDNTYTWWVNCSDGTNEGKSAERTITIDTVTPLVYLMSPEDDNVTTDSTPTITFNVTDEQASTLDCTLYFNGSDKGSNSSVVNNTPTDITASSTVNGQYLWWVNCSDGINVNKSEERNITINSGTCPDTYTSIQSGDWADSDTWGASAGCYPQSGNNATVSDTHTVTINGSTNATVHNITIDSNGILNMSAGSNLTFDDVDNCGFEEIIGTLNLNGNSSDKITISVAGASPTNDWEAHTITGTWYAKHANFDNWRGYDSSDRGLNGLTNFDNVNITNIGTYLMYRFPSVYSSLINSSIEGLLIYYTTAGQGGTYTFDNTTIDSSADRFQVGAVSDKVVFNNIINERTATDALYLFTSYINITFNNFSNKGGIYIGDTAGDLDFTCNNCNISHSDGITFESEDYKERHLNFNNSNFTAVTDWNLITTPNSYIASENHNSIVNSWHGWFYNTNLNMINSEFRFDSSDNVTIREGNLSADLNVQMYAINITENTTYEVTNGSSTEGYQVIDLSGNITITNGSFNNFTITDMNNTRAWFYNSTDIQLHPWTTLPAGGNINITGKAVNISNTSTSAYMDLNISYTASDIGSLNESNLKIYKYNGTEWEEAGASTGVNTTGNYTWAKGITSFSEFAIGEEAGDIDYPQFSSYTESPANNTAYSSGADYDFNVTITSTNGTAGMEFNGTNYTASNTSSVFNVTITDLATSAYSYYWWALGNGTQNNFNTSGTRYYTIAQASSSVNLTLNDTQANITITQGSSIDLNCSTINGDSGAYLAMYREGALINNNTSPIGNTTTFNTAQVENITCIYQNTQNYSTSSDTWWVNVTVDYPVFSGQAVNNTSIDQNDYFCVNVTIIDASQDIDTAYAEIWNTTDWLNYTLTNETSYCGGGGDVWENGTIQATANGTWNYSKVWANDSASNSNSTDFADIEINVSTVAVAPNMTSVVITPASPTTSQDLTCSATATDANGDNLTLNFTWYNSTNYSVVVLSETNSIASGGTNTSLLTSGNTSVNDIWNCSVFANDGANDSSLNSTTVTIVSTTALPGDGGPGSSGATITPGVVPAEEELPEAEVIEEEEESEEEFSPTAFKFSIPPWARLAILIVIIIGLLLYNFYYKKLEQHIKVKELTKRRVTVSAILIVLALVVAINLLPFDTSLTGFSVSQFSNPSLDYDFLLPLLNVIFISFSLYRLTNRKFGKRRSKK